MHWKRSVVASVVVAPLLIVLAYGFGTDPRAVPSMFLNKAAPSFTLSSMGTGSVSLNELVGRPLVINFWASWCEPCKAEHDILQAGYQVYGERVEFVGVVYQDAQENAEKYLRGRSNLYRQLVDSDGRVGVDYGVTGVPETFFVDAGGIVRHKHTGALTPETLTAGLKTILTQQQESK